METMDYNKQATDFLDKHGLTFEAEFVGKNCPPRAEGTDRKTKRSCTKCGGVHGWEYRITLLETAVREDGKMRHVREISFPFWNSWADCYNEVNGGKQYINGRWVYFETKRALEVPSAYDVLSSISSDTYCETSFEGWCDEFGYDKDSRRAEAMHKRCMEFALQLRQFFTDAEIEDLREIQ